MKWCWILSLLCLALLFGSCDPWFSYSPFEAHLEERYRQGTARALARLEAVDDEDFSPFRVALLSDPHYHYRRLARLVDHLNAAGGYDFVIVVGDLTDNGLKQEFIYFHEIMSSLEVPYLTAIGNHDHLANGALIYRQMFGARNYAFTYRNVRFVVFDNTTLESNRAPDMDWLAAELREHTNYRHLLPVAHIPAYDLQMKDHGDQYHALLKESGVSLSLHGHRHDFSIKEPFGDGIQYLTVAPPHTGVFTELNITAAGVEIIKRTY